MPSMCCVVRRLLPTNSDKIKSHDIYLFILWCAPDTVNLGHELENSVANMWESDLVHQMRIDFLISMPTRHRRCRIYVFKTHILLLYQFRLLYLAPYVIHELIMVTACEPTIDNKNGYYRLNGI